ncbi:hypothetical protein FGO68_gene9552 [Halteria grandinella]|uniref:Uncharacterized protein n=1 Tax=Halteria grandinella TaxID=5974 RepID=A0A8J8NC68_HALGN|nr:hypothetical protein FGO68_gene9552 [Halteria grandinella]
MNRDSVKTAQQKSGAGNQRAESKFSSSKYSDWPDFFLRSDQHQLYPAATDGLFHFNLHTTHGSPFLIGPQKPQINQLPPHSALSNYITPLSDTGRNIQTSPIRGGSGLQLSKAPNRQNLLKKIIEIQRGREKATSLSGSAVVNKRQRFTKDDIKDFLSMNKSGGGSPSNLNRTQTPALNSALETHIQEGNLSEIPDVQYNVQGAKNYKHFGIRAEQERYLQNRSQLSKSTRISNRLSSQGNRFVPQNRDRLNSQASQMTTSLLSPFGGTQRVQTGGIASYSGMNDVPEISPYQMFSQERAQ